MVSVQIVSTGQLLEVVDEQVTYIKTSGDMGDITAINSSYSWSMKFPKTPDNTTALRGLGLIGSASRSPYEKIYVNLLDNGMPIVVNGLLNIKETTQEYYGLYIQEGYVDFLKDIKSDTLGSALDLTPLDHIRDLATITNSFDGSQPYMYMIADFNGGYLANVSNTTNMDVNYMIPFANVGFIFNQVFVTYGWTFTMNATVLAEIDNRWMSYPSEIVYDDSSSLQVMDMTANPHVPFQQEAQYAYRISFASRTLNPAYFTTAGGMSSSTQFICLEDGNYQFNVDIRGHATSGGSGTIYTFIERLYINGTYVMDIGSSGNSDDNIFQIALNAGDTISFIAYSTISLDPTINVTFAEVTAGYLQQGTVSFTKALLKYKVYDYVKEIMIRFALTPFVDSRRKHIEFLTLDERLNADVVDWSDKYVLRKSETYLYQDYAQFNYFRHKYHRDGDDYNDGSITVQNENLPIDKDIYISKSYSPDEEFSVFVDSSANYNVPKMRMFDVEIKEEGSSLIATYTRLKDRFYFATPIPLGKTIYINSFDQDEAPLAAVSQSLFKSIVSDKYANFNRLTNNAKVHQIDVELSEIDIVTLDLKKRYYFAHQAAIYIFNRLKWESGKVSTGEFIRIE